MIGLTLYSVSALLRDTYAYVAYIHDTMNNGKLCISNVTISQNDCVREAMGGGGGAS